MLDITNDIQTESPLPPLVHGCFDSSQFQTGAKERFSNLQDVHATTQDILNAPSLSISLKTVTDAGAYIYDEHGRECGGSFFKSELKRSNLKKPTAQKSGLFYEGDNSCIIYEDED
jgi:hypothetical protein